MIDVAAPAIDAAPAEELSRALLLNVGVVLAHRLGMPLPVAGGEVVVSEAMVEACRAALGDSASELDQVSSVEASRRISFAIRVAGEEIERLGLNLGLLKAPTVEPEPTPIEREPEPVKPEPEPAVEELPGDCLRIDGRFEVRSSDGKSWHVVNVAENRLMSWHASREAARGWVLNGLADGTLLRAGRYGGNV